MAIEPAVMVRVLVSAWLAVVALIVLAGCPHYGFVDDGTSVSYGPSNRGMLLRPARLPGRGQGYEIPRKWQLRGLNYGTDEMIALIVHTGRQMWSEDRRTVVQVADLSYRRGGPSAWHRSHQTGRDVDLLFLLRDARGRPVRVDDMIPLRQGGRAIVGGPEGPEKELYFDVERNWILIRTLMQNPIAEVQYIFVHDELRQLLLDHARSRGESAPLIDRAAYLLHQPSDSAPHDDHFHVRILCARSDRALGCRERGVLRWIKKDYKYGIRRLDDMHRAAGRLGSGFNLWAERLCDSPSSASYSSSQPLKRPIGRRVDALAGAPGRPGVTGMPEGSALPAGVAHPCQGNPAADSARLPAGLGKALLAPMLVRWL
ncbi:MAG: penicillin-insensitive murein endopeptidase [Proteobacteria bacterium]|nr:penicillin-insensitive murein endopeptidase [Pseudomonadota bacterium]